MYIGIDLGTTNSVLAKFDGENVSVVPNSLGENLTPSVVRIDGRGALTVGRRAFRFLESDPANTRAEFKRLMGSADRLDFKLAGRSLLPEELSAEVLRSLLADARDQLGYSPRAAAISTPALFELPQNHATARAGTLAGLEEVALIQEPIASAIAAGWKANASGLWLVFDLGGGTLDVSLLETKDQWLRVVDHAGDNFLGGKDFDNALVDWALEQLRAQAHLPDLARSNPLYARAVSRLKVACEQAKIDLSRADRATIQVSDFRAEDSSAGLEVDLSVTRADFERLVQPLIQRSLLVCRSLLDRHRLSPAAVEKVVFVGGPTLTPVVRSQVGETFSGRVAEGVDPMTVVARGAALYAATAAVDARPRRPAAPALSGLPVQIEHPNVTSDPQPFVVGRFLPPPGSKPPRRVRIERQDRDFVTADSEVSKQGSFVLQVDLAPHKQNRFRLVALDAGGAEISLSGAEFAIVHGVSIADPPLSRTVGVARSDNTVLEYFKKGTPLPARRTLVHRARAAVTAGAAQDVLNIPVVQGESQRAHRNRLIGTLRIPGTELKKNLPLGVAIEVTLHLDRSGQLKARADIPLLGQSFENVATVLVPSASPEVLAQEIAAAEARLAETRGRAFKTGNPEPLFLLEQADELLAEARAGIPLARGGDADSAQRTHRLLLELNTSLDNAEETTRWPELEAEADEDIQVHLSWVSHLGSKTEQELFDKALESANQARKNRDFAELERQLRVIRSLGNAAFAREPRAPAYNFEWYASQISEATDLRQAQALVEKGRAALAREDMQELRTINRQLRDLYPGTPEERRLSYDSGVH